MRPLRAAPNGVLTTKELTDRGFSHEHIEAMVRWAWLIRLHRGIYLVPAPQVLSRAALMAAGEGAVLCLVSALAHLDLRPRVLGPAAGFRRGGFEVVRFSASEVEHDAATVAATVLAARPSLRTRAA